MKKFILGAFLAFTGMTVLGQVTVEHTYEENTGEIYLVKETTQANDINVKGYIIVYEDDDNIEFYSENHIFSHSISIELNNFSVCQFASKKLFNNDDKIEFVLRIGFGESLSILLYNEDGDQLYDFDGFSFNAQYISNGSFKMLGSKSSTGDKRIFTLGGTPPGMDLNENGDAVQERNAYPNPAKQLINLQYELAKGETATMAIYNQNGQRIDELKIGSYFKECQLDVSGYTAGVYFYAYNGITKKFVVQ